MLPAQVCPHTAHQQPGVCIFTLCEGKSHQLYGPPNHFAPGRKGELCLRLGFCIKPDLIQPPASLSAWGSAELTALWGMGQSITAAHPEHARKEASKPVCTFPLHPHGEALLIAAVLAAVALALVDEAVLVVTAGVDQVLPDGPLKEALAALAAVHPIVLP